MLTPKRWGERRSGTVWAARDGFKMSQKAEQNSKQLLAFDEVTNGVRKLKEGKATMSSRRRPLVCAGDLYSWQPSCSRLTELIVLLSGVLTLYEV